MRTRKTKKKKGRREDEEEERTTNCRAELSRSPARELHPEAVKPAV